MPRSQQGSHAQPGLVEAASAPSTPGLSRRGDAILCLLDPEFDKLYNQIKTHPQADVRQRFLEERAFRAYYLEGKVVESYDKLMAFRANVRRQKKDLIGRKGDVIEGEKLIERLCRDLDRLSRANEQDSFAAKGPLPDEYFMKECVRPHFDNGRVSRAPNGLPKTVYGRTGRPVPRTLTTPQGGPDGPLRSFITLKLMLPLNDIVFEPLHKLLNRLLGRKENDSQRGVAGRTLDLIEAGIEATLATLIITGLVVGVYNIGPLIYQFVAASFGTILFLFPMAYLSDRAAKTFTLAIAFWAVVAVFLANSDMKSCDKLDDVCGRCDRFKF